MIDRREIVKGMAWAVPIIAVSAMTPLAAASGDAGACEERTEVFDPRDYNDHRGVQYNAFLIRVDITASGHGTVTAVAIRSYPWATALNVEHALFDKTEGVNVGDIKVGTFRGCNPSFIQVDGNNVHWYGHLNGGKGGFQ